MDWLFGFCPLKFMDFNLMCEVKINLTSDWGLRSNQQRKQSHVTQSHCDLFLTILSSHKHKRIAFFIQEKKKKKSIVTKSARSFNIKYNCEI